MCLVHLERANRTNVQVWKVADQLTVDPVLHFTVTLFRCISSHH